MQTVGGICCLVYQFVPFRLVRFVKHLPYAGSIYLVAAFDISVVTLTQCCYKYFAILSITKAFGRALMSYFKIGVIHGLSEG
jgi:hypothetical protein